MRREAFRKQKPLIETLKTLQLTRGVGMPEPGFSKLFQEEELLKIQIITLQQAPLNEVNSRILLSMLMPSVQRLLCGQ